MVHLIRYHNNLNIIWFIHIVSISMTTDAIRTSCWEKITLDIFVLISNDIFVCFISKLDPTVLQFSEKNFAEASKMLFVLDRVSWVLMKNKKKCVIQVVEDWPYLTLSSPNKLSSAKFLFWFNCRRPSMLVKVGESTVWVTNSLDLDETPSYSASHPDQRCLHMVHVLWLWLVGKELTLCMLGNFFKYLCLSKFSKNSLFPPIVFADI